MCLYTYRPDWGGGAIQVANNGIIAVPMMIAHIGQIVMDGFLAASWAQRTARQQVSLISSHLTVYIPGSSDREVSHRRHGLSAPRASRSPSASQSGD